MAARKGLYTATWWGRALLRPFEETYGKRFITSGRSALEKAGKFRLSEYGPWLLMNFEGRSKWSETETSFSLKQTAAAVRGEILDAVAADPFIVAALAEGLIPHELPDLFEHFGAELIPRKVTSYGLDCGCGKRTLSGGFCRHEAALLLYTANWLDVNPFLLFTLRGIDLTKELKDRGIDFEDFTRVKPMTNERFLDFMTALMARDNDEPEDARPGRDGSGLSREERALRELRTIPYTRIPDLTSLMIDLFPRQLAFSDNDDCRAFVRHAFGLVAYYVAPAVSAAWAADQEAEGRPASAATGWKTFLGKICEDSRKVDKGTPVVPLLKIEPEQIAPLIILQEFEKDYRGEELRDLKVPRHEFFPALLQVTAADIREMPLEFECWREISLLSAKLLLCGAVMPTVVMDETH